ncbi:hypothetical protein ACFE04_004373 [Oxalis oulophora]
MPCVRFTCSKPLPDKEVKVPAPLLTNVDECNSPKRLFTACCEEIDKRSGKDLENEPKSRISEQCAATDYVISLNTDVFIPSHRGNIGRAMKGRRVYVGHMKCSRRLHRKLDFLKRNSEV